MNMLKEQGANIISAATNSAGPDTPVNIGSGLGGPRIIRPMPVRPQGLPIVRGATPCGGTTVIRAPAPGPAIRAVGPTIVRATPGPTIVRATPGPRIIQRSPTTNLPPNIVSHNMQRIVNGRLVG